MSATQVTLKLIPHLKAPPADLPVRKAHDGLPFIADLTLPRDRVIHGYRPERATS